MEHKRMDVDCMLDNNYLYELSVNSFRSKLTIPGSSMTGKRPAHPISAVDMRGTAKLDFSPWAVRISFLGKV
jgi:hypothetical protein